MRYLPNQYINPALTIRDREKEVASSNLNQPGESAPYIQFKRDTSTDDPEDYRGQPAYGVEEDGQGFFTFPFVQAPDKKNTNKGMKIAGAQDINTKMHILNSGMMVDENGIKYMWSPREKKFIDMGPYDPYYDGMPIPLGKNNKGMKINQDVAMFPRLSTGEPMTNMEKKQGLDVLRKTRDAKQIKRFVEQMMKGV
tara:strand:+ start:253 stop:840 length:588 start_codon:yes stop_codon:yes gene_type:complete